MDYVEINVPVADQEQSDIVMAILSDFPFESFVQENHMLKGYIRQDMLADCKQSVDEALAGFGVVGFRYIEIEPQNWNAVWEAGFEPVEVEGLCTIRAPFSPAPQKGLDIVIMPKMSFGTGHHATTWLMVSEIMKRSFDGLSGLDMGSGTGVLAIAAVKRGAAHMDAVDIDDWAYENSLENLATNGVAKSVTPILGDATAIEGKKYDFILANINLNILKSDMPRYHAALNVDREIIMSGILESDIEKLSEAAVASGFKTEYSRVKDGWAVLCARKSG